MQRLNIDNKHYMEPPSSVLTDGKSKADPRSEDPLPCIIYHDIKSLRALSIMEPGAFIVLSEF